MQTNNKQTLSSGEDFLAAPLWRRIAAMFYDFMMVFCVVFVAWQPMPLLPDENWPVWISKLIGLSYLFLITFLFFGWFWTHGGQTIGMRAWRIKLIDATHSEVEAVTPGWKQALRHYIAALISWIPLGGGYFLSLFRSDQRAMHDLIASTRLVVVEKKKKGK